MFYVLSFMYDPISCGCYGSFAGVVSVFAYFMIELQFYLEKVCCHSVFGSWYC